MRDYIKLFRVKHYIKNVLLYIPIFFDGNIFNSLFFGKLFLGFMAFCSISSAVYILNDLKDMEQDQKHPVKKNRPIASGKISKIKAIIICIICILGAVFFVKMACRGYSVGLLYIVGYFALNVLYSGGLKNIPLVDIIILASGFVIRVFYGAFLADITVSGWLYLVIITGALYMGLGKRRNELGKYKTASNGTKTRKVLDYYSYAFLDKNMYVCVALVNVFYALWVMELSDLRVRWTIPLFIVILMKYSLSIECEDAEGDPVEVIIRDKGLLALIIIYCISLFGFIYLY